MLEFAASAEDEQWAGPPRSRVAAGSEDCAARDRSDSLRRGGGPAKPKQRLVANAMAHGEPMREVKAIVRATTVRMP